MNARGRRNIFTATSRRPDHDGTTKAPTVLTRPRPVATLPLSRPLQSDLAIGFLTRTRPKTKALPFHARPDQYVRHLCVWSPWGETWFDRPETTEAGQVSCACWRN